MTTKLLITCPDQAGIVNAVTGFITENKGNILDSQQHSLATESDPGAPFFMRLNIDDKNISLSAKELSEKFKEVSEKFSLDFKFTSKKKRMAIMVSKYDHCLYDVLLKHKYGEIDAEIPVIISNHPDLKHVAEHFGIEYIHLPIETDKHGGDKAAAKKAQEAQVIEILQNNEIDLVVMARYMQILTGWFIDHYPYQIINVHHSFLPSFKGANPYRQAYEKGVKIIGATAHYATEDLDMGPIICQDICPVNYKDKAEDYVSKGRDVEKLVFAKAIKAHLEDKIIIYKGRTIVFN